MSDKPDPSGQAPRRAAHAMIMQVTTEGRLLSELLPKQMALAPADRARAQRLATDTFRGLDRADRLLKPHLRKAPPMFVKNALRLGVTELGMGGAAHAVVNAYVDMVGKHKRTEKFKGLVNAVLRKITPEDWAAAPVPVMPRWLRSPLVAAWGRKAMAGIEKAHFAGAPLDLTCKDPHQTAADLGGTVLPTGSVRLPSYGQVSELPGYAPGDWWVQDAAAAVPVSLLGDVAGLSALDLCAAPGGKTLQLAQAGARVTAVDTSDARLARVTENLKRTNLTADLLCRDAFDVTGTWDVVVLDAPCSATGTLRRHPDLPYAKDGSEFFALIEQQTRMIDHALTLLRPGGRLLFCTCSLLPDEGEVQVQDALARHPGLHTDPTALERDGVEPDWITPEGGLRLRPDYWAETGGIDGFYMAIVVKP